MLTNLLSLFLAFLSGFFHRKEQGEKAIETVIKERESALESVKEANDTRARIANDPDYDNVIRLHFERRDSD